MSLHHDVEHTTVVVVTPTGRSRACWSAAPGAGDRLRAWVVATDRGRIVPEGHAVLFPAVIS